MRPETCLYACAISERRLTADVARLSGSRALLFRLFGLHVRGVRVKAGAGERRVLEPRFGDLRCSHTSHCSSVSPIAASFSAFFRRIASLVLSPMSRRVSSECCRPCACYEGGSAPASFRLRSGCRGLRAPYSRVFCHDSPPRSSLCSRRCVVAPAVRPAHTRARAHQTVALWQVRALARGQDLTSTMIGVTSLDATRGEKKPAHGTTIARTTSARAMADPSARCAQLLQKLNQHLQPRGQGGSE